MGIEIVFIIWILVVVIIFFLARNYNITWWSSLVLALFFGLLVLLAAIHLPTDDLLGKRKDRDESSCDRDRKDDRLTAGKAILGLLALISIVIIIIYIIQRVFEDRCSSEYDACDTDA